MTIFFRLLDAEDKGTALQEVLRSLVDSPDVFSCDSTEFSPIPGKPFAYWSSKRIFKLFNSLSRAISFSRKAEDARVLG
jgi:hypothetical protein